MNSGNLPKRSLENIWLHVLELFGETIDQDHGDDVLDGHHACPLWIKESDEGVFESKESVNILCEGGGRLQAKELKKMFAG